MADGERSSVLGRSTADLIRRLINDANGLVELQIRLVKLEARENLASVLGGAKWLGIAAGLGFFAVIGLVVFIVTGLGALFVDILNVRWAGPWFWSLILTIITGALAALFALRGIRQAKISPMQRTRETLREDLEWLRQPMKPVSK